jgi:hypothetical protein
LPNDDETVKAKRIEVNGLMKPFGMRVKYDTTQPDGKRYSLINI